MIKMIAMDLDGTLLTKDKIISDFTLNVLRVCRSSGVIFIVVTARSEAAAAKLIEILKPDIAIYNNGAVAKKNKDIIFEELVPINTCQEFLDTCFNRYNLKNTKVVTYKGDFSNAENITSNGVNYVYNDYKKIEDGAYKITIKADPIVAKQLAECFIDCHMIKFEGRNSYMFTSLKATKEIAVKRIADYFKVQMNEIIAFGDDLTDMNLLRKCGMGIAVANAIPEVKNCADFICESNDNDGVAKWINSHMELFC